MAAADAESWRSRATSPRQLTDTPPPRSVRALLTRATRRESGLLVPPDDAPPGAPVLLLPASARPRATDDDVDPSGTQMLVAPTLADLTFSGEPPEPAQPSMTEIAAALGQLPFEPAMHLCALIAAELLHHPHDRGRQLTMSEQVHSPQLHARMRHFLTRGEGLLLFDPRHVAALPRLLVVHAAPDPPNPDPWALSVNEVYVLTDALVALAGALPKPQVPAGREADDDGPVNPADWADWAAFIARSGAWYDEPDAAEAIARTHARYLQLHASEQLAGEKEWTDIERDALETTKLTLAQQAAGALGFAAASGALDKDAPFEQRLSWLRPGLLASGAMASLEPPLREALASTRDELAQMVSSSGETPEQLGWDHTVFERRPFLRMGDGQLLLMSARGLLAWMTRGIHHRSAEAADQRPHPNKPDRTARDIFMTYEGALGQELVRQLLERSHQVAQRAGLASLLDEHDYRIGKKRKDSPDAALACGPDLVLFEVYSGRIPLYARADPAPAAMLKILEHFTAAKLGQLAARTAELLADELRYPKASLAQVRRVWPVLVLAGDPIMQSTALWEHLRATAPHLFEQDRRVQRPVIMDLDSLEPMLACVEAGESMPALLAEYLRSPQAQVSPRTWLAAERPGSLQRRPAFVDDHYERAWESARQTLFGTDSNTSPAT